MAGQHFTGWGLPSFRRAVAVQWDAKIPPTVGNSPWRHALRQLSIDLKPVTTASRVVSTPKATLECPLQVLGMGWGKGEGA